MKLLFVCTGNTCRSAMAQALAEKMIKDNGLDFEVDSAGLFADGYSPASENAKRAVEKYGATLDGHISTPLTLKAVSEADKIYAMTADHLRLLVLSRPELAEKAELFDPSVEDVPDPYGGSEEVYEKCAERICECLKKRLGCEE